MIVCNKKVNPEEYPDFYDRKVSPVTWGELGNRFHTTALRGFHMDKNGYLDKYKEEIELFTRTYDLGDILWLHYSFIFAKNFKEAVHYIKGKGLYVFDPWGYVPSASNNAYGEYKTAVTPNGDAHQYLLQVLGSHFLGWDNGEQDGRFFAHYASLFCPSPQNRREAYEGFSKYFHHLDNDMANYLIVLLGMYFAHYMAHFGNHRLLGAETAQALPSVPPWYAFIRGAGKQYGILWYGNASIYNRWGCGEYGKQNKQSRKDKGTSLELLKRLWYVEYMYGSCIIGYEAGHIFKSESSTKSALTCLGQLQVECTKWCKKHPDIGVQYTPVALLMDFYTGWAPPRSAYHHEEGNYLAWGNMYYEKGDHQVDAFFRLVYPAYEDASYYKDERGFLTSTPAGDIFDVLLSNLSEEVLHRYNLVIVLGEIRLEGKLLDKIKSFSEEGGRVIISSIQLSEEAKKEFNVRATGIIKESKASMLNGNVFKERLFQYEAVDIPEADTLATSGEGDPLILRKKYGKGEIVVITIDFGLNKEEHKEPLPNVDNDPEVPLPAKYYLLDCVKAFLLDYLKELNLFEITGAPIQYITNVTDDSKKLYLTLSNNENKPWEGSIKIKGGKNIEVEDLFANKKVTSSKGEFKTKVKPLDVGIHSIEAKEPVVGFKKPFKGGKETNYLSIWSRSDAKASIWQNIETIGRSSFTSIEICATQVLGMSDVELSLLSEELKAGNLDICALSLVHAQTPYVDNNNLSNPLPWTLAENRKFLSRSLKIVEALECKRIILSTGKLAEGQSLEEVLEVTANIISEFGREAKESGISILVEPAPYRVFGKAEELVRLVDKVDLPNVGIALDTGHSFWFDGNPIESLKKLGSRVKYINLNSPAYSPGSGLIDKHLLPGEGVFDQKAADTFLNMLKEVNFNGIVCLNGYFPAPSMESLQKEWKHYYQILRDFASGWGGDIFPNIKEPKSKEEVFRELNIIDQFYILGPFENTGKDGKSQGLKIVYPPEKKVVLRESYIGKAGKQIKWKRVAAEDINDDGYVNLCYLCADVEMALAYAYTVLKASSDTNVTLQAGSDDGIAVWLNGKEIYRKEAARSALRGEDNIPLSLKQGNNELLLKIDQKRGGWGFYANFAEPNPKVTFGIS